MNDKFLFSILIDLFIFVIRVESINVQTSSHSLFIINSHYVWTYEPAYYSSVDQPLGLVNYSQIMQLTVSGLVLIGSTFHKKYSLSIVSILLWICFLKKRGGGVVIVKELNKPCIMCISSSNCFAIQNIQGTCGIMQHFTTTAWIKETQLLLCPDKLNHFSSNEIKVLCVLHWGTRWICVLFYGLLSSPHQIVQCVRCVCV